MKVTIDGVDYPMPDEFSYEEMGLMKRVSGLLSHELYDALENLDPDAALAFAACARFRDDPRLTWQQLKAELGSMPYGSITLDFREDGAEVAGESPPAGPAEEPAPDAQGEQSP